MSRRRAAAVLAVALVVAAVCTLAGWWQWNRHQDRSAAVALVEANFDAPPVPLADLAADGLADDEVWRPVRVRGAYVGAAVLRNRPVSGTPAAHALAVLQVADGPLAGRLLVVDRGWFPAGETDRGRPVPAGETDVVVRLRAGERPSDRTAPDGQVQAIAVAQVVAAAGIDGPAADAALPGVYGSLVSEDGAAPSDVEALPRPDLDLGPHLSYAFQWWVFAVGALVGAVLLLRREQQEATREASAEAAAGTPSGTTTTGASPARASAPTPPARPRRRRPTAEDEEDAILDAAERAGGRPAGPTSRS